MLHSKNSNWDLLRWRQHRIIFVVLNCVSLSVFHASITIFLNIIKITTIEAWNLVPQSKNSIRENFFGGVCILSFNAYQIVYPYQVSCLYHNLP